jgi:chaperone required for assembly of F1-ATPase
MSDLEFELDGGKPVFDPVKNAQKAMRAVLPRRFYKIAQAVETDTGFAVQLDGRTAKTSGRKPLAVPTKALAELVAVEFAAQKEFIDPFSMTCALTSQTTLALICSATAPMSLKN